MMIQFLTVLTILGLFTSCLKVDSQKTKDSAVQGEVISASISGNNRAVGDTNPPTAPANLSGSQITPSSVNVSWDASLDNVAVRGYKVYRRNLTLSTPPILLAATASLSFLDQNVNAGHEYVYVAFAFDTSNNISARSNSLVVDIPSSTMLGNRGVQRAYIEGTGPEAGKIIIDVAELHQSINVPGSWQEESSFSGGTGNRGDLSLRYTGSNFFDMVARQNIRIPIKFRQSGSWRLCMLTRSEHSNNGIATDYNDTWFALRRGVVPDTVLNPSANQYFDITGFAKVYNNRSRAWGWHTATNDHKPYGIIANFEAGQTAEIVMAARSQGFRIRSIALIRVEDYPNNPCHTIGASGSSFYTNTINNSPMSELVDITRTTELLPMSFSRLLGEKKVNHPMTIEFAGDRVFHEEEKADSPFTNRIAYMKIDDGVETYYVPGHFAADGNAAQTMADSGNKFQFHFNPKRATNHLYSVYFAKGLDIAMKHGAVEKEDFPYSSASGSFSVSESDVNDLNDFRHALKGPVTKKLGAIHFSHRGNPNEFVLKAGKGSPESLFGSTDFQENDYSTRFNEHVQPQPLADYHAVESYFRADKCSDLTWGSNGDNGKKIMGHLGHSVSLGLGWQYVVMFNTGGERTKTQNTNGTGPILRNGFGDANNVFISPSREQIFATDVSKMAQMRNVFECAYRMGMSFLVHLTEIETYMLLDEGYARSEWESYVQRMVANFNQYSVRWSLGEEDTNGATARLQRAERLRYYSGTYDNTETRGVILTHNYPGWLFDNPNTSTSGDGIVPNIVNSALDGMSIQAGDITSSSTFWQFFDIPLYITGAHGLVAEFSEHGDWQRGTPPSDAPCAASDYNKIIDNVIIRPYLARSSSVALYNGYNGFNGCGNISKENWDGDMYGEDPRRREYINKVLGDTTAFMNENLPIGFMNAVKNDLDNSSEAVVSYVPHTFETMTSYFYSHSTALKVPGSVYAVKAYKPHSNEVEDLGFITGNGMQTFTDIPDPSFSPPYLIVLQKQ